MKPPFPKLIEALIWVESRGDPNAISPAGAKGLCQLLDATGREWCAKLQLGEYQPFDPVQNRKIGEAYLKAMIAAFTNLACGIGAYNCGPGNMQKAIDRAEALYTGMLKNAPRMGRMVVEFWPLVSAHVPDETRLYVPRVLACWSGESIT